LKHSDHFGRSGNGGGYTTRFTRHFNLTLISSATGSQLRRCWHRDQVSCGSRTL
jgi:hypothetical protein